MEQCFITLSGKRIAYFLKKSARSRNIHLAITSERGLVVTLPGRVSGERAEYFIKQKADWVIAHLKKMEEARGTEPRIFTNAHYARYRYRALRFMKERVQHFESVYSVKIKKIAVRNQKTRWGSCSKNGTLTFSYKLMFLASELADYVVVHEICHTLEFNHSKKFWNLVVQTMPHYKTLRRELKRQGLILA